MKTLKDKTKMKGKKGVSLMVEYVLLVTFTIVIAVIVYAVLKTYVPQNKISCPEGTSLLIESYSYDCTNQILTLDLRNSGRFDLGGYFIHVTDDVDEELATIDIRENNTNPLVIFPDEFGVDGIKLGNDGEDTTYNDFAPNQATSEIYNLEGISDKAYLLTIVPMRWQVEKNKNMIVSCSDEGIEKRLECD
jgi:hypothetical protein